MSSSLISLRAMEPADYAPVRALWEATENVGLNESDEEPVIAAYLARNVGLSCVAITAEGRIIGAVLCGHDGRRGTLNHLAVAQAFRRQGVGRRLVEFAIAGLQRHGISKCNLFVFAESHDARAFWEHHGWKYPTWQVMQKRIIVENAADGSC